MPVALPRINHPPGRLPPSRGAPAAAGDPSPGGVDVRSPASHLRHNLTRHGPQPSSCTTHPHLSIQFIRSARRSVRPLDDLGGPAGSRRQLSPRRLFNGSVPASAAGSPLGRLSSAPAHLATTHAFTSAVSVASSMVARPFYASGAAPGDPASMFSAHLAAGGRAPASFIGAHVFGGRSRCALGCRH